VTSALDRFKARYWSEYAPHMQECERRLSEVSGRPAGTLGEACTVTLAAGGKRLRPLLVFLTCAKEKRIGDGHYAAAAAVELVHSATLVHDDVLDRAELRRGQPTLMARYGAPLSTSAGDYLFSTAFELLAGAGSPASVTRLAQASLDLSRGELLQMEQTADFDLTLDGYSERCRLKTASLFSAACQLGALLSGCSPGTVAAMDEFGRCLGLSFQISDDILDFTGDEAETGKRPGADLRDGTVTLPLVLAMRRDPSIRDMVDGGLSEEGVAEVCRRVVLSGTLDETRAQGEAFVMRAKEVLTEAAAELQTAPLELIAEATLERKV
jgi:geranylgeranyl pyrophosphate synthase